MMTCFSYDKHSRMDRGKMGDMTLRYCWYPKILLVRESVILLRKINIFYYERKKVEYNSISVKVYDNNK
jgi:hypothetical protein